MTACSRFCQASGYRGVLALESRILAPSMITASMSVGLHQKSICSRRRYELIFHILYTHLKLDVAFLDRWYATRQGRSSVAVSAVGGTWIGLPFLLNPTNDIHTAVQL